MRAVRAARAALLDRFAVLLPLAPGLVVFLAVVVLVVLELWRCADELGELGALPELWPLAGATVISKASAPASKRCSGGAEVGELKNLMLSL